jgi:tRNA A-37 threonylcarbamoyl transferase component Bud32
MQLRNRDYIYEKHGVSLREYRIHKYVESLGVKVPRIYGYDPKTKVLQMQRLPKMDIANTYGDDSKNVPEWIFDKIRDTIEVLYSNNVEYPDITGYNFIEYNGHVYILDFGHAKVTKHLPRNKFILDFIYGKYEWNPEYL